jgi:hypothetical protein
MSLFVIVIVAALVGLFVLISLLPILSEGAEKDSLVQLHD